MEHYMIYENVPAEIREELGVAPEAFFRGPHLRYSLGKERKLQRYIIPRCQ
jgi:hypothetical protein